MLENPPESSEVTEDDIVENEQNNEDSKLSLISPVVYNTSSVNKSMELNRRKSSGNIIMMIAYD